jgi:hypothetical protein
MLPAVPSDENVINKNSKAVKKTGNAKTEYQELILITILLLSIIINAKNKGSKIVKMTAGTMVATVTR